MAGIDEVNLSVESKNLDKRGTLSALVAVLPVRY
jgi:hypothetical protein